MLWWLSLVFFGDLIPLMIALLSILIGLAPESPNEPDYSSFFKDVDFMFPEDFLSRYPNEANPFRLKIMSYLIFNLLVKGYGSVDPSKFWSNYNHGDFNRVVIDAVFHQFLTNFTNVANEEILRSHLRNIRSNPSKPLSSQEIAVDRIGQYLDLFSENERAYDILCETNESTMSKRKSDECDTGTTIRISGIPGIDYPNFCEIPKTSFSCADKKIPGIYADFETGCQAFHVCWPSRRDTFLCPIGTIFNQSLLTCDTWDNTGCFSSPLFHRDQFSIDGELDIPVYDGSCKTLLSPPLRLHAKFLPSKCEVRDISGKKLKCQNEDIDERIETTNQMIKYFLQILKKLKRELDNEMKSRETTRIHVLARDFNPTSKLRDETNKFLRRLNEIYFQQPKVAEQNSPADAFPSEVKPGLSVIGCGLLEPSNAIKGHTTNPVPEIVKRSLRLSDTISNEGVIHLEKQIMIDSYRKMESKRR